MVIVRGVKSAFSCARFTRHFPSAPATTVFFCLANVTVTDSPGSAQPQIGTGCFCCKTIELAITSGSLTSARAETAKNDRITAIEIEKNRWLFILPLGPFVVMQQTGHDFR